MIRARRDTQPVRRTWISLMQALVFVILTWVGFGVARHIIRQTATDALFAAVRCGNTFDAARAIASGAEVNARYEPQRTWQQYFESLLGHKRQSVNTGLTPLMFATGDYYAIGLWASEVVPENPEMTRLLLSRHADPTLTDSNGNDALDCALRSKHCRSANLLIHGMTLKDRNKVSGYLVGAINTRDTSLVESLLHRGADANYMGNDRVSPLGIAIINQDEIMVRCLLRHGADPDRKCLNDPPFVFTPIQLSQKSCPRLTSLLREAGARR